MVKQATMMKTKKKEKIFDVGGRDDESKGSINTALLLSFCSLFLEEERRKGEKKRSETKRKLSDRTAAAVSYHPDSIFFLLLLVLALRSITMGNIMHLRWLRSDCYRRPTRALDSTAAVLYNYNMIEETPTPSTIHICALRSACVALVSERSKMRNVSIFSSDGRRRRRRPTGETECARVAHLRTRHSRDAHTEMKYCSKFLSLSLSRPMTQQQFNCPLFTQQFATPCRRRRRRRHTH